MLLRLSGSGIAEVPLTSNTGCC